MENRRMMRISLRIVNLIQGAGKIELSAFAASSAFFLFLSLIPILLLLCSVIPYTGITQAQLLEMIHDSIGQIAPTNVTAMVENAVSTIYSGGVLGLSVSALVTLWAAGKAFLALMRGMDVIHGEGRQNYIVAHIKSCFYTLVTIIVMVVLLVGVVFGKKIAAELAVYFPPLIPLLKLILNQRYLVAWVVLSCLFTGMYTWIPKKKLRLRDQIPGALFSAGAWIGFSALFSWYINHSGSFGIYGSLTTIVIALLWMYYCMYILLLGTYLNVTRSD